MLRTKIKYENQQRAITQKYDGQIYGSCALHFSLIGLIHLWGFKVIPEILFELCSGEKLSMKINKVP